MMLISLNTNVPRYFIEHYAGSRELGFFAATAYILLAGTLVLTAACQAATPRLAQYFQYNALKSFRALLAKLVLLGLVLGIIGLCIAAIAGRSVLSLIYQPEYAAQSPVLILLMIAAAIGYIASIFGYGLTSMRCFGPQVGLTGSAMVATACACVVLVPTRGLKGAAMAIVIGGLVQCFGNLFFIIRLLRAKVLRIISQRHIDMNGQ
jgi:O-antigen/teichoic acid export membrane protein